MVIALPESTDRFRLLQEFLQYRAGKQANQPGTSAYLLDQDDFTTQRLEWTDVLSKLDRFEQTAGQFFRLCVSDQFHQAMVANAA